MGLISSLLNLNSKKWLEVYLVCVLSHLNGKKAQINNQQWANDHGIGFTGLGSKDICTKRLQNMEAKQFGVYYTF